MTGARSLEQLRASLTASRVQLTAWPAAGTSRRHQPMSAYVETFWLPVIGPSAFVVYRRFATWLLADPAGVVELDDLDAVAATFGLRTASTRGSLEKAIARLVMFGLARDVTTDPATCHLQIVVEAPDVDRRHIVRFPEYLQAQHATWQTTERPS